MRKNGEIVFFVQIIFIMSTKEKIGLLASLFYGVWQVWEDSGDIGKEAVGSSREREIQGSFNRGRDQNCYHCWHKHDFKCSMFIVLFFLSLCIVETN